MYGTEGDWSFFTPGFSRNQLLPGVKWIDNRSGNVILVLPDGIDSGKITAAQLPNERPSHHLPSNITHHHQEGWKCLSSTSWPVHWKLPFETGFAESFDVKRSNPERCLVCSVKHIIKRIRWCQLLSFSTRFRRSRCRSNSDMIMHYSVQVAFADVRRCTWPVSVSRKERDQSQANISLRCLRNSRRQLMSFPIHIHTSAELLQKDTWLYWNLMNCWGTMILINVACSSRLQVVRCAGDVEV
jgi:hypothetical protein